MEDKMDEMKGRVKEAAGDLTDNQSLKNEGRVDKASGSVKDKIDSVADKVKDAVNPDDEPSEERDPSGTGTNP